MGIAHGWQMEWARGIIAFWFGLKPEQHWDVDPDLDAEITARFRDLWEKQRTRPAPDFAAGDAEDALAAIILFDQFPRNMFRGDARSFATDVLALDIAKAGVAKGFDQQIARERRHFFYMPFEHSEALADQERSLELFEALGDETYIDFARKHHDVIARFGRFPHRNAVLGRTSTPEEKEFGLEPAW